MRVTGVNRHVGRRAVVAVALFVVTTLSPYSASAGTGLTEAFWSAGDFSIQLNSNNNVVGFWRTLLRSMNQCPGTVNAVFDQALRTKTIEVQQTWQTYHPPFSSLPADGVVNHNDWDAFEFSYVPPVQGQPNALRFQYFGFTDGFGTQYWTYYGGGNEVHLGFNPVAHQDFFDPYMLGHLNLQTGWSLLAASSSSTMGSYSCSS